MAIDFGMVAATLDDVIATLNSLVDNGLDPARTKSMSADRRVNFEQMYEGAAKADLEFFYKKYAEDIAKLSYYYWLARRYLERVQDEIKTVDAEIALMIPLI